MKTVPELYEHFLRVKARRDFVESTWRECYEYALPQSEGLFSGISATTNKLFDGTAPDSVDQLAASMLSELMPPWSKWFDLTVGSDVVGDETAHIQPTLEQISDTIQAHFDHSGLSVEIHQCFLDLITAGTACLLFEESAIGEKSAFHFTAVPISELYADEGYSGRLDTVFRCSQMPLGVLTKRFGQVPVKDDKKESKISVIEAILPARKGGYDYIVFVPEDPDHILGVEKCAVIQKGFFATAPLIVFRWLTAAGEIYGRSPVMKALPDIKTANKVVELILKNATIAVTGIWQAEDDGVLNPANIRLTPGAIIPKAVGSKGLTPLEAAGNFDISQLVLNDLRSRIRHALLVDKLGQVSDNNQMTATEVIERSQDMVRVLGATYGRLQTELLNPLLERAIAILKRRGEIPELYIDGRLIDVQYKSPLARQQQAADAQSALNWITHISKLGTEASDCVNLKAFVRWLAQQLNVPMELLNNPITCVE